MRPRESHRRTARRIWLVCQRDGTLEPEALQVAVERLMEHPERGGLAVLAALGERLRRFNRRHHARVESAQPLSQERRAAVVAAVAASRSRVTSVDFAVDPALGAGIQAQIGYTVYDGSIRGRLERLGSALLDE